MINKQIIISNIKQIKRKIKETPESARQIINHARLFKSSSDTTWEQPPTTISYKFREYRPQETQHPVHIVTPRNGHYMTTFFDVDPFSPSGRYLAVTQVPFINRIPVPGDRALICIIDLITQECEALHETYGWGAQLGANVQWGNDDDTLFFNDFIDNKATGIRFSRSTRKATVLDGPIFGLSPDKRFSYSPDLQMINALIPGYGVPDPLFGKKRAQERTSHTEGVWRTDLNTGKTSLYISINEIVSKLNQQNELAGGFYYAFNMKVNKQNSRLFVILFSRKVPMRAGAPVQLVTIDLNDKSISLAMPDELWRVGGHHPNWTPDGDHILGSVRKVLP